MTKQEFVPTMPPNIEKNIAILYFSNFLIHSVPRFYHTVRKKSGTGKRKFSFFPGFIIQEVSR